MAIACFLERSRSPLLGQHHTYVRACKQQSARDTSSLRRRSPANNLSLFGPKAHSRCYCSPSFALDSLFSRVASRFSFPFEHTPRRPIFDIKPIWLLTHVFKFVGLSRTIQRSLESIANLLFTAKIALSLVSYPRAGQHSCWQTIHHHGPQTSRVL